MRYLFRLGKADSGREVEDTKPWMPLGKVCMVAAPGGTGKSTFLAALAVSVAGAVETISGLRPLGHGGGGARVLFVLAEEDQAEVERKVYAASRGLSLEQLERVAENLWWFAGAGKPVRLYEPVERRHDGAAYSDNVQTERETDFAQALTDRLNDNGPTPWNLVILDPASRFTGARDENDNQGATRFVESLEALAGTDCKPTVLIAHHTGKGKSDAGAEAARGASSLVDGVRWVATMQRWTCENADEKAPRAIAVNVNKSNYTAEAPAMPTLWLRMTAIGEGLGTRLARETAAEAKERAEYAKGRAAAKDADAKDAKAAKDAAAKDAKAAKDAAAKEEAELAKARHTATL